VSAESGKAAMRFAIVGAGVIGTVHARLISSLGDRAKLVAVVDVILSRATSLASTCGAAAYADVTSALAAEEIDAVAVCVPSAWHGDIAVEALRAGKDVLIEKPLSTTLEDADRIIAAEKDSGCTVAVISQRRFQPPAVLMREAIAGGVLGRITSGVAESPLFRSQNYYDSGDWRGTLSIDGGGALMNQGIHTLDLLLWMMGTPARVSARTAQLAHERIEVEDVAAATIEFESGALGVLLASTAAYPGLPVRVTIHGDQGVAGMQDDRLHIFESAVAGEFAADPERKEEEIDQLAGWSSTDIAHRAQYADFIQAVTGQRPPKVTTSDGRLSLATVLAVYESARTGGPVELDGVRV
jgi:UDP-N-acetyl-2-amino-2-deoxyglucuronate dehydrogenase